MNARELELALKKQRLQFESAALRAQAMQHLRGVQPALQMVDRARSAYAWVRGRPALWVGAAVALAVMRPRVAWRWFRRGWMVWQAANRLSALMPLAASIKTGESM